MALVAPDKKQFENLLRGFLATYHMHVKDFDTAWEVLKDDYNEPIAVVPYLNVRFKDDADILAELEDNPSIRVRKS